MAKRPSAMLICIASINMLPRSPLCIALCIYGGKASTHMDVTVVLEWTLLWHIVRRNQEHITLYFFTRVYGHAIVDL